MEDEFGSEATSAPRQHAGTMLAKARKKAKLDLAEVSLRTRIPQRHLAAIEEGDYSRLPSRTYAVGFSRTYARAVGLDERAVTDQVRLDLAEGDPQGQQRPDRFEPGDPARVPSRRLAWFSALAVVLLVIGAFTFYRTYFSPGIGPAPLTAPAPAGLASGATRAPRAAPPTAPTPSGSVVFTSLIDGTWVKFYDGAGKRLFEGQMARGQTFAVPSDAQQPQVWTGRPDALAITIGGRQVPKLAETEGVMRDVPVTAEALLARPAASAPVSAPTPVAAPIALPAT